MLLFNGVFGHHGPLGRTVGESIVHRVNEFRLMAIQRRTSAAVGKLFCHDKLHDYHAHLDLHEYWEIYRGKLFLKISHSSHRKANLHCNRDRMDLRFLSQRHVLRYKQRWLAKDVDNMRSVNRDSSNDNHLFLLRKNFASSTLSVSKNRWHRKVCFVFLFTRRGKHG